MGNITTLHAFYWSDGAGHYEGAHPAAGLIQNGSYFYGTTLLGGADNDGTVFKMDGVGNVTTLHQFNTSTDNSGPNSLLLDSDGNCYGTAEGNNADEPGFVFKMNSANQVTSLYRFAGFDGSGPNGLVQVGNLLYGATYYGGGPHLVGVQYRYYWDGIIYSVDATTGAFTTLYNFDGTNGANPNAIIRGSDGNFYGTAYQDEALNYGTVFKMTPTGAVTLLHSFGTSASSGVVSDPFGYGGQAGYYTDLETGFVLLTYRYYDPGQVGF